MNREANFQHLIEQFCSLLPSAMKRRSSKTQMTISAKNQRLAMLMLSCNLKRVKYENHRRFLFAFIGVCNLVWLKLVSNKRREKKLKNSKITTKIRLFDGAQSEKKVGNEFEEVKKSKSDSQSIVSSRSDTFHFKHDWHFLFRQTVFVSAHFWFLPFRHSCRFCFFAEKIVRRNSVSWMILWRLFVFPRSQNA